MITNLRMELFEALVRRLQLCLGMSKAAPFELVPYDGGVGEAGVYPLVGEVGGHQQPLPVELHSLGLAQLGREGGVAGPRPAGSCTEFY